MPCVLLFHVSVSRTLLLGSILLWVSSYTLGCIRNNEYMYLDVLIQSVNCTLNNIANSAKCTSTVILRLYSLSTESNYAAVSDEEPDVSWCLLVDMLSHAFTLQQQDPAKEIEAEMVLDCFEKFNEVCACTCVHVHLVTGPHMMRRCAHLVGVCLCVTNVLMSLVDTAK